MPSIQIFTDPLDRPRSSLVTSLARYWRRDEIHVEVGSAARVDADVGILNVDQTWISPQSLPSNPRGRPLLNGGVLDISKRRVSVHLLTPDSRYDGKVIVKTDANARGIPELRARQPLLTKLRMIPRFYAKYEIFDRLADVPDWVWLRTDLVVERFIPEMEGGSYILRSWIFFGDQEYNVRMTSSEPIVKLANISGHEFTDDVPDSLREVRASMAFDFGKFDYVVVDGEAVLFDANKTPTIGYDPNSPRQRRLAGAIYSYLPTTT